MPNVMKKARLFAALLLLGCCLAATAQNKYVVNILERPDLNKQQLYEASKRWYHLACNHRLEDVVISENESSGTLLYKMFKRHSYKYNGDGMMAATIEITVKDGKARFVVEDITQQYNDKSRPSLQSIQEHYDPARDMGKAERNALKDILPEADAWIDSLWQSYLESLAGYRKTDLSW